MPNLALMTDTTLVQGGLMTPTSVGASTHLYLCRFNPGCPGRVGGFVHGFKPLQLDTITLFLTNTVSSEFARVTNEVNLHIIIGSKHS